MAEIKKKGSRRNKDAGYGYELKCRDAFVEAGFPFVVTSRSESRSRDGQGVDLINKNELVNGRLEYNVQCKCTIDRPDYHSLLSNMPVLPNVTNVVLHKYTGKSKSKQSKGLVFMVRGTYAIMPQNDFFALVEELQRLRKKEGL